MTDSDYLAQLAKALRTESAILLVCDGRIHVCSGGSHETDLRKRGHPFSVGPVVDFLRSYTFGPCSLCVDTVSRNPTQPADVEGDKCYRLPACHDTSQETSGLSRTNFRFNDREGQSLTIDSYSQIWLFGDLPGGLPSSDPNELDASIDELSFDPEHSPTSSAELLDLCSWMTSRDHGVFATGDHHVLGSSMCARVPRVRNMRVWRVADGASTVGLDGRAYNRVETPATLLNTVRANGALGPVPSANEADGIPQPISPLAFAWDDGRPIVHPLCSHPQLGVIDVLPDHIHSGLCFDVDRASWTAAYKDAQTILFFFDPSKTEFQKRRVVHYPGLPAARLPVVAAVATTSGKDSVPPASYENGSQESRRFAVVVAYPGFVSTTTQSEHAGPVVVDATFHHWMRMNLAGLFEDGDLSRPLATESSEKIRRYFVNVAWYLAPRVWRAAALAYALEEIRFHNALAGDEESTQRSLTDFMYSKVCERIGESWLVHIMLELREASDSALAVSLESLLRQNKHSAFGSVRSLFQAVLREHFKLFEDRTRLPDSNQLWKHYVSAAASN